VWHNDTQCPPNPTSTPLLASKNYDNNFIVTAPFDDDVVINSSLVIASFDLGDDVTTVCSALVSGYRNVTAKPDGSTSPRNRGLSDMATESEPAIGDRLDTS
jgi:hypothetical protein